MRTMVSAAGFVLRGVRGAASRVSRRPGLAARLLATAAIASMWAWSWRRAR